MSGPTTSGTVRSGQSGLPRAIATDLDGTLLRSDGTLSARTRSAIQAVEAVGILTVFVTARPPRWLDALVDAVGHHGIALCGNGAFVYDVPSRTVIEQNPLEAALLSELITDLRGAFPDLACAVERADGFEREQAFVDDYCDEYTVRDVGAMSAVGKLLARSPGTDPEVFRAGVGDIVGGRAEVGYSGAVGLAEISAPGITKAAALARWCVGQDIDPNEVWAFGDMPNDLPMIEWAGTGFAVRNAHPDLVAVADQLCPSNDEDGVAQVMESLVIAVSETLGSPLNRGQGEACSKRPRTDL